MRVVNLLTALLLTAACGTGLKVQGQTDRGDWLIGGQLELNTAKSSTTVQFSPNAGFFVAKNFAIGGNIIYSYNKLGALKVSGFGIGPFVRYYFTEEKVRPFFAGDMTFEKRKFSTSLGSSTEDAFSWFLGGGAAFFINENVAVDGLLGYAHSKVTDEEGGGGLRFRVGFQVYINRHQVQSVRSSLSK